MRKAVADLEACTNFADFTDIWFSFLTAFKSIYTTLEQGAKPAAQSRQWFGGKQSERRRDELLQYLYQARNDEEHGLDQGTEDVPGRITAQVRIPASGVINLSRAVVSNGQISFPNASLDEAPKLIEHVIPHVALISVKDRSGNSYSPPISHLGAALSERSPLAIARLALTYSKGLVKEAEGLK